MTTNSGRLTVFADARTLGIQLAAEIAELADRCLSERGTFILGCPGGRTPMSTYQALAVEFAWRRTDLSHLVIAMMDDYVVAHGHGWATVPATAHNSCRRFAHEDIQAVLNAGRDARFQIVNENVWLPDPAAPTEYDQRLSEHGGVDFFILASGAGDGHIAFNPPGSAEDSTTRIVELAEQTRRDNLATFPDFTGLDEVPSHGVTVGVGTIATQSRRVVMIAHGADKREAVRRLTTGDGYDSSWPATIYRTVPGARLYADVAAAR